MFEFPLSTENCELLVAFESLGSVYAVASHFHKDISIISRRLKELAECAPVLEKKQGKWQITEIGKNVTSWARDSKDRLSNILHKRSTLRVGATREFASRVLCPNLREFLDSAFTESEVSLFTADNGIEELLLSGQIDFGFDCGRPNDPSIKFKQIKKENFGIFLSPEFLAKHKIKSFEQLVQLPNLQYKRVSTAKYLQLATEIKNCFLYSNDLSALRAACSAGLGWTILPKYSVKKELDEKTLVQFPYKNISSDYFGVWVQRGKSRLDPIVKRGEEWLNQQDL